jgi:hypothetical protein
MSSASVEPEEIIDSCFSSHGFRAAIIGAECSRRDRGGSQLVVSPRRSSDQRPVQSSRCPDRSDHFRQLLDIDRRSDHHVADYDFHSRRGGRLRRSCWRRCGINHQGRERCCRALWQRQLTLPKPPPPIVNLPACRTMLARHRRHLNPGSSLSAAIRAFSASERTRRPVGPSRTSGRPPYHAVETSIWASILPSTPTIASVAKLESRTFNRTAVSGEQRGGYIC